MFENDDSSDDIDESLFKQVLPTADDNHDPIDLNKLPTTGEEYLRQVRYEASRLPDFQTAAEANKRRTTSSRSKTHAWHKLFSSTNTTSNVTIKHNVSMDWQNEQSGTFSNVRNDFFQMRDRLRSNDKKSKAAKLKNANNYWTFCFGNDIPYQSLLSSFETDDQQQTQYPLPTMTKMITLTQLQLHELLQHEIDWLKQCGCSIHLALFMFATLVAIEKPVSEDVLYTMRQACFAWKEVRVKLLNSTDDLDHNTLIKSCDLFVCIIGRYFGQFDLADTSD